MSDLLIHFKPGEVIGLVAVAGGLLVALTAVLGGFWYHGRLMSLKQDMVNRGMSADDIRTVLDAGTNHQRGRQACRA